MLALITGGSGSGKSEFAEGLCMKLHAGQEKPMLYVATMYPYDDEAFRKIARHRRMRRDKNFGTQECFTGLSGLRLDSPTTVLLECMSNLVANEIYQEGGAGTDTVGAVLRGVENLRGQSEHLVIVTNEIFSDGIEYDPETVTYQEYLGKINTGVAAQADLVVEVVYGIPLIHKGAVPL